MTVSEVRNTTMPLIVGTGIGVAASAGAATVKRGAALREANHAWNEFNALRHAARQNGANISLKNAQKAFVNANKTLKPIERNIRWSNCLNKPFGFFNKGAEKLVGASGKMAEKATELGAKTYSTGFKEGAKAFTAKSGSYAATAGSKIASGSSKVLRFLGTKVPRFGVIAGAFEAFFRFGELKQGLKEGRRADAVGNYATKVVGTGAAAVGGAKLGLMIGKNFGPWGALIGTVAGIGLSMAGSWLSAKVADGVFGKNKGTALSGGSSGGAGATREISSNTAPSTSGNAAASSNGFDFQKEMDELNQLSQMRMNLSGMSGVGVGTVTGMSGMGNNPYAFNF